MAHQHHEWRIQRSTQVKDLYQIVCAASCHEVLILVEVAAKDVVSMRVDTLHIFTGTQVPDTTHLIACRTGEDCVVSRVPYRLVGDVVVLEASDRLHRLRDGGHIPQLDGAVVRGRQCSLLIQMVPFTALHLGCVATEDSQWLLWVLDRPKPECAVASRRQDLVGVSLRKADVEGRVWRRNMNNLPHCDAGRLSVEDGDSARAKHAEVLALGYRQQVLSEWTESRGHIREEHLATLNNCRRVQSHLDARWWR